LRIQRVILLLKLRDPSLYDADRPLAIALARAEGEAQSAALQITGNAFGGLPNAEYPHVAGEVVPEEAWRLHITPAAVAALPPDLRQTVAVGEESVARLVTSQFDDLGVLIHYEVLDATTPPG
jgi:hypothetical protein